MSTGHDDSSNSNKHFTFTIENGAVTAYFEVENGITQQESIDNRDSFVIDGTQITHTKQSSNGPEITVYSDPEGDGSYKAISDSNGTDDDGNNDDRPGSGDRKGYQFTINENNEVVEVFEIKKGVPELEPIDDDGTEVYSVTDAGDVIRADEEPFGTEITRYSDADGDGIYHRVSEEWSPSSPGAGFKITDRLDYSPSSGDDRIGVRGGEDCHGGQGADDFVIREAAHLRIGDFNSSEDKFIIFDTGLGLISREHLESFVTNIHRSDDDQDFIVDFGSTASVTLVGVASDQISWDDVSVLS
ncbi:hypothetical protein [uncultured Nitrosomonas sp.]|uniref:hypothetical protein n=1 Tax=uncultured Nitrosomonas sp. TaxID=156424 RepID=UPI0025F451A9|nr:hypothetical protein [uncultured Nitrosomonas sp.]